MNQVKKKMNQVKKKMNKVKGYRVMLGMTQKQLGDILGCTAQAISSKEKGKTQFNDKEKIVFLNLVKEIHPNITIDDLFF